MGGQLRVYRRRIASVKATKQITRAQELIATARIVKAQQKVAASTPYAEEITRAVSAVASRSNASHALTTEREPQAGVRPKAAVLVVTSDRGFCGGYNTNTLKEAEQLMQLLREQGKEPVRYVVGRKGVSYNSFRERSMAGSWVGFSDNPAYTDARTVADEVIEAFLAEEGGMDEIHLVSTRFISMLSQQPTTVRILPLQYEETTETPAGGVFPLYEFEPSPERVLDALLPHYVRARIYNAMLQSAASEHAARRRAMKSATDNASDLIDNLTRQANAARQAEITQEISEIVGGANALADANVGSD
ncbi:ATP synthase F1, gamma subunit [Catenulispora acidiphila DSM 44928]|uniref:ATP synthase gamma chain n=1 Tax=Catenulispora acidiphila (strain DSM 44928 / JCM 14897 / NBRC 102108 / NRRL B-24433 / ID139908) TaxID=479433 RepID=C7Q754_CATAD|nr:F0F1 ATP synthase subunit gamma [Catenulispora acidiphila]ACU70142.1 ATP synthase F1, gamma subunit [Catenulispora acidiphila DSM 44928]